MSALRNLKAFLAATTPSFDPVVVVWHAKKDGGPVPLRRVDLADLVSRVEELERRIREADEK